MNKVSLIAALLGALLILAAYAIFAHLHGWVQIEKHTTVTSYYAPGSVENEDGKLHLRLLLDYDAPQAHSRGAYRSVVEEIVLNCSEHGYYSDKRTAHEGAMGAGAALFEDKTPLPYKQAPAFFAPIFERYCKA